MLLALLYSEALYLVTQAEDGAAMVLLWYEAVHLPSAEQAAPSSASDSALVRPLGSRASTLGTRDLTFLRLRAAPLCPAPCKLAQWLLWVLVAALQAGSVAVGVGGCRGFWNVLLSV